MVASEASQDWSAFCCLLVSYELVPRYLYRTLASCGAADLAVFFKYRLCWLTNSGSMAKPPSLMRKLSGASDTGRTESNATDAPPSSSEPSERSDAAAGASSSEPTPAVARKEASKSEAPAKPWEAPAWRAHCAQEREAARQVKPYESDLVDVLGARFGCVASGTERDTTERSDEEMWHDTASSLTDLKRACLEYGFSAGGSKEGLAARIYHPDQPDPLPKKRRRQAEILARRRQSVQ